MAVTRQRLEAVRQAGSPSAQCLAVLSFLEIESVAEIRDLLENSRFLPPHAAEFLGIDALLRRWLELEPTAAMDYCRAHHPNRLAELIGNFAATHPAEAERLATSVPAGYWASLTWKRLCLGVATTDPEAAWALLQRTPENAEYEAANAAGKLAARDLAGALARIQNLPKSIRWYAMGALALEKMKVDPAAGWAWIRSQPDPAYMLQHTVDHNLRRDPGKAFALLASLTPEEIGSIREKWRLSFNLYNIPATATALAASGLAQDVRQTMAEEFIFGAQQSDPAAAAAFFVQMSPEAQAKKVAVFLNYWTDKDPAAASAWQETLPAGPLREAAEVLQKIKPPSDPAEDNAAPPDRSMSLVQDSQIHPYISPGDPRLITLTPEAAEKLITTRPEHGQTEFIGTLARSNPAAITTWLEKDPAITGQAGPLIGQFFNEWASHSPAEAAAWVSRQPDSDAARTAAINTARQYLQYAPAEAQAWVNSLPPGPPQEAARKGLTSNY